MVHASTLLRLANQPHCNINVQLCLILIGVINHLVVKIDWHSKTQRSQVPYHWQVSFLQRFASGSANLPRWHWSNFYKNRTRGCDCDFNLEKAGLQARLAITQQKSCSSRSQGWCCPASIVLQHCLGGRQTKWNITQTIQVDSSILILLYFIFTQGV